MAIERLVGLFVTDDLLYQKYREHMLPLLQSHGGEFGYDFRVSEVLKSKTNKPINRIFTIYFTDENAMNTFFSDTEYLKIRKKYFDPSVSTSTIISKYEC